MSSGSTQHHQFVDRRTAFHRLQISQIHVQLNFGVEVAAKCILCAKVRPDYESLFSILDSERRYWIEHRETEGNICDIEVDNGQMSAGVEIQLDNSRGVYTMMGKRLKSEIAQHELSDLGCRSLAP